jgi:hypothetical protein
MGGKQSKPQQYKTELKPSAVHDVTKNLLWCLNEITSWEDRSMDASEILSQKILLDPSSIANTQFDKSRAQQVLHFVDQIVRSGHAGGHAAWEAKIRQEEQQRQQAIVQQEQQQQPGKKGKSKSSSKSKPTTPSARSTTQTQSATQSAPSSAAVSRRGSSVLLGSEGSAGVNGSGMGSARSSYLSGIGSMQPIDKREVIARGLPDTLQPLPISASKLFAASAAEVVSNAPIYDDTVDEQSSDIGGGSKDASPQQQQQHQQQTMGGLSINAGEQVPQHDRTAVTDILAPFDPDIERKELVAKYLFIHAMLEKLSRSASYSYKLQCKIKQYDRELLAFTPRQTQTQTEGSKEGQSKSTAKKGQQTQQQQQQQQQAEPTYIQSIAHATVVKNRRHCEQQLKVGTVYSTSALFFSCNAVLIDFV